MTIGCLKLLSPFCPSRMQHIFRIGVNRCLKERLAMADGDKTAQPTGRARGRARGRPRTAEELAAMRRPGETTTTPSTTAQGFFSKI